MFIVNQSKPVEFSNHALERMAERGATKTEVERAIRAGNCRVTRSRRFECRLNFQYGKAWQGRTYAIKQVVPVVADEPNRLVVVTVYTFYF